MTAADYLRERSDAIVDHLEGDCVSHACAVAALLHAEGKRPSIGGLREVVRRGDAVMHAALIPLRFVGMSAPAWTTHYVCCSGDEVYDPLAGEPLPLHDYAVAVFGRPVPLEAFLDAATTDRLLREGSLLREIRAATAGTAARVPLTG